MNRRSWINYGTLALAINLGACSALSNLVDTSKRWTAKLTGADDPSNTSALAQAGRLQNAGTDAVAGVAGIKTDPSPTDTNSAPTPTASTVNLPKSGEAPGNVPAEVMSVAEMQRILQELGYQPGPADGANGKRTREALRKYQRANGLTPTGALNADTTARLRGAKKGN